MTTVDLKLPHHQRSVRDRRGQGRAGSFALRCGFGAEPVARAAQLRFLVSFPCESMDSSASKNKFLKLFHLRGVSATVSANTVKTKAGERTFHMVGLTRTYRDGDLFKSSTSLSRDDLPVASLLLQKAWEFILTTETSEESNAKD